MHKGEVRRLKAHLTLATADMQAAKVMVRNPDALDLDRLRCHVVHFMESGGEILKLLNGDQPQQSDTCENERPITIGLDSEVITVERKTINTNGLSALEEEVSDNVVEEPVTVPMNRDRKEVLTA